MSAYASGTPDHQAAQQCADQPINRSTDQTPRSGAAHTTSARTAMQPPMMSGAYPNQQPPAQPGDDLETDDAGGTTLCIRVDTAGQISVYTETGGENETAPQPMPDKGQALAWALKNLNALVSKAQPQTGPGAENSGFNSVEQPTQQPMRRM